MTAFDSKDQRKKQTQTLSVSKALDGVDGGEGKTRKIGGGGNEEANRTNIASIIILYDCYCFTIVILSINVRAASHKEVTYCLFLLLLLPLWTLSLTEPASSHIDWLMYKKHAT